MDYRIIYGSKNEEILVDIEDYEYLNQFSWNCYGGYARTFRRRKEDGYKLRSNTIHRLILNNPKLDVDHINGNKLDNRRSNLRLATPLENNRNQKKIVKRCSSKYKGVVYHSRDLKWQAQIRIEGKRLFLGYFKCEEEAALAYNKAAIEHHKEFAVLNVITPEG